MCKLLNFWFKTLILIGFSHYAQTAWLLCYGRIGIENSHKGYSKHYYGPKIRIFFSTFLTSSDLSLYCGCIGCNPFCVLLLGTGLSLLVGRPGAYSTTLLVVGCGCITVKLSRIWLFRSLDDFLRAPLNNPVAILQSSCYNPLLRTVVYTFGYRGRTKGPATTAVLSAYLATRKRNVILLDWEEEAKSGMLGIKLGYILSAVPNAKHIGEQLGDALAMLAHGGLNMSEVHLMGHSLGAHVMAYAGKRARQQGQVVARITGLDPARALFEGVFSLYSGLDRTCAKFVDIIHSNPGQYGTSETTGTVDLWPNFNNTGMQPGCPIGSFEMFTPEDLCSHDRSWRYLVESVKSATAFPASSAANYDTWVQNEGVSQTIIYLGDLTNTRARGNFYLTTNPRPPFGMGPEGLKPDDNQIRARRHSDAFVLNKILQLFR